MTIHLTKPNPELARMVARTPPGMMFWSGTSSDPKATCAGCKYFGYSEVIRNEAGNAVNTISHPAGCALYFRRMGKPVKKPLRRDTPACKYFEPKQS